MKVVQVYHPDVPIHPEAQAFAADGIFWFGMVADISIFEKAARDLNAWKGEAHKDTMTVVWVPKPVDLKPFRKHEVAYEHGGILFVPRIRKGLHDSIRRVMSTSKIIP